MCFNPLAVTSNKGWINLNKWGTLSDPVWIFSLSLSLTPSNRQHLKIRQLVQLLNTARNCPRIAIMVSFFVPGAVFSGDIDGNTIARRECVSHGNLLELWPHVRKVIVRFNLWFVRRGFSRPRDDRWSCMRRASIDSSGTEDFSGRGIAWCIWEEPANLEFESRWWERLR